MKTLIWSLVVSLGVTCTDATAKVTVTVDGAEYTITELMENCRSMTGAPEAQIACFNALSEVLEKRRGAGQDGNGSVPETFEALRAVAEYQGDESGLSISGNDCKVQFVYFNNYYHLSRRNVSTIDVLLAEFDASKLQYDQSANVPGAQAPFSKAVMEDGIMASVRGGLALESTAHDFEPKSARATIVSYANEVVMQLPSSESQAFNFVLVHPERGQASEDIWKAFEAFVTACKT